MRHNVIQRGYVCADQGKFENKMYSEYSSKICRDDEMSDMVKWNCREGEEDADGTSGIDGIVPDT